MASERERALNRVALIAAIVVGGAVILGTSEVFAQDVWHVLIAVIVLASIFGVLTLARIRLELKRVQTWRPPESRPFRLTVSVGRSPLRPQPDRPALEGEVIEEQRATRGEISRVAK